MAQGKKITLTDEGNVSYKRNVVRSIVTLATQEISGIAGINTTGIKTSKKLFNKNYKKGVIIEFVEGSVYVDVFVDVLFGYSVRDVAFRVQENIKSSIESMTDFKAEQINVNVTGVVFDSTDNVAIN